jgi:hypothetical protein
MRNLSLAIVLVCAGCGRGSDLMPMRVGETFSYDVHSRVQQQISKVTVVRETGVAGVRGFVFSGPMGESRLAWKGDSLLLDRTGNCRFDPPLILLVATSQNVRRTWTGTMSGMWGAETAKAQLDQGMVEEQIGGRRITVAKSFLDVVGERHKVRLQTLFQPGVGIASQKEWVDGELVANLERLSSR